MVHNAMWSNGSAVVFAQEDGESLVDVNCNNFTECNTLITIPATMIPHYPGSIVRDALLDSAVQVSVRAATVSFSWSLLATLRASPGVL